MKLLLLTDCPPCKNLTGGLVLDQLCRFLPRGSIACFAVTNPDIEMKLTPDLDWIPIRYARKPSELGHQGPSGAGPAALKAAAAESYRRLVKVPLLIDQAVEFAREHKVDAVWTVLEGQTIVRMAVPLATRLGLPLFTLVWDPLSWWLSAHKVDRWNSRLALRQFDEAIARSEACAVASWAMAEHYEQTYGVRSVPVIASHDAGLAVAPPTRLRRPDEVVLGMAGQFYASDEWHGLVAALNAAGWRVGGREVRLKVLGHYVPASDVPEGRLDFLGWKSQPEAIKILANETDVLYCPYPFDPKMEEVSRFSFPSKLPLYFASGRPVLFHGPDYSSPGRYLTGKDAGLCCNDREGSAAVRALERLVTDPALYERLAVGSQRVFAADFTLDTMRAGFLSFLGLKEADLSPRFVDSPVGRGPARSEAAARPRRPFVRRAALAVPKVRQVYDHLMELRELRDRLALRIATLHGDKQVLRDERDSLRRHIGYLEESRDRLQSAYMAFRTEVDDLRASARVAEIERRMLLAQAVATQDALAERDLLASRLRTAHDTIADLMARNESPPGQARPTLRAAATLNDHAEPLVVHART